MITLGIDPGTAIMGYGLVESGAAVSVDRNARASGGDTLRLIV
jgi:Holliday junction resolvasome RuvABC endonuclease subunit